MSDLQEPPKTVKEVGIHLFYLNQNVNKLTELVEKLQSGFVTTEDFDTYKSEVADKFIETKRRTWIQNFLSIVFGIVITLLVTNWFNK